MKKFIMIISMLICFTGKGMANYEMARPNPDAKGVKEITRCIMTLRPMTTPYLAIYIAANIVEESKKKSLSPYLVLAVSFTESSLNPHALSKKGACGLMGVRYITWRLQPELKSNGVDARDKLFWVDNNIQCGTDILQRFVKEAHGNIGTALYRYNTGNPKLDKQPWEVEYVSQVLYYEYRIREYILHGTKLDPEEVQHVSHEIRKTVIKK